MKTRDIVVVVAIVVYFVLKFYEPPLYRTVGPPSDLSHLGRPHCSSGWKLRAPRLRTPPDVKASRSLTRGCKKWRSGRCPSEPAQEPTCCCTGPQRRSGRLARTESRRPSQRVAIARPAPQVSRGADGG